MKATQQQLTATAVHLFPFGGFTFLFMASLVLFAGCASSPPGKIQSHRDNAYTEKLGKVLIIQFNKAKTDAQFGSQFSQTLFDEISNLLVARGVECDSVPADDNGVDELAPARAIAAFYHPTHTISLACSGVDRQMINRGHEDDRPAIVFTTGVTFRFNLFDVAKQKTVWRGEMKFPSSPNAQAVAAQFVQRLIAEGFLESA